ncbi:MAG: class I SAM-dependent methyltransferase [Verrucomicrobiota bacterium]
MDVLEREQISNRVLSGHWYYESKFRLLRKHISRLPLPTASFSSVDVGSGLGLFLHKMERHGLASPDRSIGVDPAYEAPRHAFESQIVIYPDFPAGRQFDLLVLMDVLEHVEDDAEVLKNALRHALPGGYVFITVPALPALWSSHDRFLGHYRRYTLKTLNSLVEKTGALEVLDTHYFFAGILPLAAPVRLLRSRTAEPRTSDMKALSGVANALLKLFCTAELVVAGLNKTAGLTAVMLCKVKR